MSDDWFKRKYDWVERVMAEPTLRGLPAAVAFLLARRYLNAQTQDAWPSVATLAERLNADPRNVQRALARLVAAGKLEFERGGHGPGDSNRYRMADTFAGEVRATLARGATKRVAQKANKGGADGTKRVAQKVQEGWRARHPSSLREHKREGEREFAPLRGNSPPIPRRRIISAELPEDEDGSGTATQRQPSGDERVVQFRPRPSRQPGQTQTDATRHQPSRKGSGTFPEGWLCRNPELAIAHTWPAGTCRKP